MLDRYRHVIIPTLLLGLLLSLGLIAAGRGEDEGDGSETATPAADATQPPPGTPLEASPELEAYFEELETLSAEYRQAGNELDTLVDPAGYNSTEEAKDALLNFLEQGIVIIDDFASSLEDLEPPPEAEPAHNEAIAAAQGVSAEFESLIAETEAAETQAELEAAYDGLLAGNEAFTRFATSCTTMQQLAESYGITAALQCA